MNKQVVVVVPIIAPTIEGDELRALRQCLRVLGKRREVCYLCSDELDTRFYEALGAEFGVPFAKRTFGAEWFGSVAAYNRLCLSVELYDAFADYEYMLVHQLDAYCFADELDEWMGEVDYVGGPWLPQWCSEVDDIAQWEVGNGGFSLRRVEAFRRLLHSPGMMRRPLKSYRRLLAEAGDCSALRRLWLRVKAAVGYNNSLRHYAALGGQEDRLYALCGVRGMLRVPTAQRALRFAFDMRPQTCLHLAGGRLPMGCHLWNRYNNQSFWYPVIYGREG